MKKRLANAWMLLLSVFVGILIVTTLGAGTTIYLKSLEQLAFRNALDRLNTPFLSIHIFPPRIALAQQPVQKMERSVTASIERHLSSIYLGHEGYLRGGIYLVGLPTQPLPDRPGTGDMVSRGYFQYLSNLESHSRFVAGRMFQNVVSTSAQGPVLEAVTGVATADNFDLKVGDVLALAPDLGFATNVSARIVGILEPADPSDEYWRFAGIFLDPTPLTQAGDGGGGEAPPVGVAVASDEPPVALFVSQESMVEVIGQTYHGTLANPLWFIQVDIRRLKEWTISDALGRLQTFEDEILSAMPGSSVSSGIVRGLIENLKRKSFFTRVPLLVLLVIMETTVLFFLFMMVSYLVQSREKDAALLRTRGVGTLQFLRLYALEGLAMTAVAVALAPFLAMGIVALAGKLPYFRDMTGGALLPVELGPGPFLVAGGAGLLSLVIFVIPGVVGARSGVLVHKLRTSRPPTMSFFHRYYLDVALLSLGGLTFWEMHSRGHLVSGGLFKDVEVNETLLLTPVLFLIVVALVFMRFFPLVVRFISGESPALVHLLAAATLLFLAPAIAMRDIRDGGGAAWLGPVALLAAIGGVYWATSRAERRRSRMAGLVLQAGLVGWFLTLKPLETGDPLFPPTVALISIVPVQVAFLFLKASTRAMPAWLSMGLWRMARNPLQYTWLVLLLVLASGLGILSTTVGGTLERSQEDRVMYDVAADIHVSGIPRFLAGGVRGLKEKYIGRTGVDAVSLALRETGSMGPMPVEVLGVEPKEFSQISWYRKDFSDRSLSAVMRALRSETHVDRLEIPEGSTSVGVWVRPEHLYPNLSLWVVIEDDAGYMTTVSLGKVGSPEWHLVSADFPSGLESPRYLVSVQIFEAGIGTSHTSGTIHLDDIQVAVGPDGDAHVLEGFESQMRWTPISTSGLSSDRVSFTGDDPYRGAAAGTFSFGRETMDGVRGLYQSPTGGPVPIVASSSLVAALDVRVGVPFLAEISGRWIPVVITDSVNYFPTLSQAGGGFILADLDNLLSYLGILSQTSSVEPNELFISGTPGADREIEEVADELAAMLFDVEYMAARLEAVRQDPLASAGWKAMVLISLAVVLLTGAFGYVTYLLLFATRSRGEVGFLQSLGLSRPQLMGLLGFEHLAIVVIGVGLGTWAGFQMSRLMVSPLAVTERGQQVVPPFILMTDWSLMLPTYGALIGVFLAALVILNLKIGHLDLNTIARVEEY